MEIYLNQKDMDYKRLYEQSLERARVWKEKSGMPAYKQGILDDIFPELKGSKDEQIRKAIIEHFASSHSSMYPYKGFTKKQFLAWLEKQGGQKPFDYEHANIQQKDFAPKVEPKFRVKYAGSEYNVLEIKDIAGVAFYGIEDEPNHIDYVKAENCEIIDGYAIKENGSPYPTKSAVFFGAKNPTWSEEDEKTVHNIDAAIRHEVVFPIDELKSMEIWLESLKYRICPKHEWKRDEKMFQLIEDVINVYRKTQGSVIGGVHIEELKDFLNCIASKQDWKPSDEQIEILDMVLTNESMDDNIARILRELREQLKKLKGE